MHVQQRRKGGKLGKKATVMRLDHIKSTVLVLSGLLQNAVAQVPVEKEAHHKIVLENEWVRVLEGRVPPHDTTPAHIHSANSVVVFLSRTGLGIRVAGQQPVVTTVAPGDIRYVDYGDKPVTHIVWDQGDSMLRFLVVELKAASAIDTNRCPIGPRPDIKLRLRQKQVIVYDWTPNADQPAKLPASSCARMVIIPTTGAFTFYPPNTPVQTRSRCIILQL
jgi:uncharacterized cupin superfamily protein